MLVLYSPLTNEILLTTVTGKYYYDYCNNLWLKDIKYVKQLFGQLYYIGIL